MDELLTRFRVQFETNSASNFPLRSCETTPSVGYNGARDVAE